MTRPTDPRCTLCGDPVNTEHPDATIAISPVTFRRGTMHWLCLVFAYEALSPERMDRYNQLAQEHPQP